MGCKYKDMARMLKRDWKSVNIVKNIITDLVHRLQPVMMTLKKTPGNRASILVAINQYLR